MIQFNPQDFQFYDRLEPGLLESLTNFANDLGVKPTILSDWRPFDQDNPNSRHNVGDAVDLVVPGRDPLEVWAVAERHFPAGGVGVYLNERGAVSFHVDTRGNKARWGALITPAVDPDTGQAFRRYEYVAATPVLARIEEGLTSLAEAVVEAGQEVVTASKAVVEDVGEKAVEVGTKAAEVVKKKPLEVVLTLASIYIAVKLLTQK